MSDESDDDGSEYRPTDFLAVCGFSYGVGANRDDAIAHALRYAGPFDDRDDDTVEVAVWELYADSWQKHGPTGPERGAEQISYTEYELPVERADEASRSASDAFANVGWAVDEGEVTREVTDD